MIRRLLKATLFGVGAVALLLAYFLVPLGRRTLYEHTRAIVATEPARELGEDLSEVGASVAERARAGLDRSGARGARAE